VEVVVLALGGSVDDEGLKGVTGEVFALCEKISGAHFESKLYISLQE
jgi:hypothetical protein